MTTINAYPLQWPSGWKRTAGAYRVHGRFKKAARQEGYGENKKYVPQRDLTINEARRRVIEQLARMGIQRDDLVISSNLVLRLDGDPRSDQRAPADPGVAVYWQEPMGQRRVMAIDQYLLVQDNLAAIAATLDAMRAIERHGGAVILERAFTGFLALPSPGGSASARHWRDVLGPFDGPVTEDALKAAYRRAISAVHPDNPGGSAEAAAAVNLARDQAREELGL